MSSVSYRHDAIANLRLCDGAAVWPALLLRLKSVAGKRLVSRSTQRIRHGFKRRPPLRTRFAAAVSVVVAEKVRQVCRDRLQLVHGWDLRENGKEGPKKVKRDRDIVRDS